tara:strand:- start:111 stop:362 length:252 start_codon:yes stop_codon:yes gene_type:complete
MPYRSLTHGRVKNGNEGPIRKKVAKNVCPKSPNVPKPNCGAGDAERKNATVGQIGGSINGSVRSALKRRVYKADTNCIFPLWR